MTRKDMLQWLVAILIGFSIVFIGFFLVLVPLVNLTFMHENKEYWCQQIQHNSYEYNNGDSFCWGGQKHPVHTYVDFQCNIFRGCTGIRILSTGSQVDLKGGAP